MGLDYRLLRDAYIDRPEETKAFLRRLSAVLRASDVETITFSQASYERA